MNDKRRVPWREALMDFIKREGCREFLLEIFAGGEEEGEIYLEGDGISSKSFSEKDSLIKYLENKEIVKYYRGKRVLFLLSRDGLVYVIHGLSPKNFL